MKYFFKNTHFHFIIYPRKSYLLEVQQVMALSTSVVNASLSPETIPSLIGRPRNLRYNLAKLLQLSPSVNAVLHYKLVHGKMVESGLQSDTFLVNILISAYSRCGYLSNAHKLFDRLSERNLVTWSAVISMYARHGHSDEAFSMFLKFTESSNEKPNEFILASILRACTQMGVPSKGKQLHSLVTKVGLSQDVYVGTALIDFYSKIGRMDEARTMFSDMPTKTAVTWTIIIAGYTKIGRSDVSLQLFNQMKEEHSVPDMYVLSSVLSACSTLEYLEGGKQLHSYVLRREREMDVSVSNVLLDLYLKCGKVGTAKRFFHNMRIKNDITWSTMISGFMQNSFDLEAMNLFKAMGQLGLKPDAFACTSILTSCGSLSAVCFGKQVHAYTVKANMELDEFVRNSLIDMYSKSDSLTDARRAFDGMSNLTVVSYNAMIEGYARHEKLDEALYVFQEMRFKSFSPSFLTFISLLGVSASLLCVDLSKQIHGLIVKYGVSLDVYAGSALIDVYSKCTFVKDARLIFDEMFQNRDSVVWNAMLFGYTQQSENEEALKLYRMMQFSDEKPNGFTFVALVTAASNLTSLLHGRQFHGQLVKTGLDFDPFVTNALLDMYAKCGSMEEAHEVFESTYRKDVACWNSMISSYAQHGEAKEALMMFEEMKEKGIEPNYVTFVGVLSACVHVGLVEDGLLHFQSMPGFGIEPGTEHYACVVSLLARGGRLHEAKELIRKVIPVQLAAILWRSLLSACRDIGNVEMGKYAAEMAISIDPNDSGSYILLSNIFASKGLWNEVRKVRESMEIAGVVKETGYSWIELNNKVHGFAARDKAHDEAELIWSVLDNLIQQIKWVDDIHHEMYPVLLE